MTDRDLALQVEVLYQNGDGELAHGKFIELAMLTNVYKSMCNSYESEVNDEGNIDPPVIFYHEQYGWVWAWGGDAGRLNELESDGDYSVTKSRKLKCLGSATLSSCYDLE